MSIGSGLGGSVGFSPEGTYGVYVAPARFPQVTKATIKKKKNIVQGGGLAASQLFQAGDQRVQTTEEGEGSFELEVSRAKMGLYLQHITGSVAVPVQQGAGPAYLQTHTFADNLGKFMTAQTGIPNRAGTVQAKTGLGGKIITADFSCKINEILALTMAMDFRQYSEAQGLAAPSYVDAIPFHFGQMGVKLGVFGAEAAVAGVGGCSVKIERPVDDQGFYANNAGLKVEPVMNAWPKITGALEVDNVNKADFTDRFTADASTSLVWEFIGPLIASTFSYTFRITLPGIFFDDDGSTDLVGPDVISGTFPFTYQWDRANLPKIEYMCLDTTV